MTNLLPGESTDFTKRGYIRWVNRMHRESEAHRKAAELAAEPETQSTCEPYAGKTAEEYGEHPRCYREPMSEDDEMRAMYPREA